MILLTIEQAFNELTKTEEFKAKAKARDSLGGKYRSYLSRYRAGKLKSGALVDILLENNYVVKAGKAAKKK